MSSGEHRLELEHSDTERCPPSFEEDRETLPSMLAPRAPDLTLVTDTLIDGDHDR